MLRLLEVALFLAPLAAFVVWRLAARRGGPSPLVLGLSAAAIAVLFGALALTAGRGTLRRDETYVPAQLQNGTIVPGHAARP